MRRQLRRHPDSAPAGAGTGVEGPGGPSRLVTGLMHRTALNVWLVAASQLLGKLATFAWTVAAARMLSQADFGAFFLALAVALLIVGVVRFGFDSALIVLASRRPDEVSRTYALTLVWKGLIAGPACVAGFAVAWVSRPDLHMLEVLAILTAASLLDTVGDTCRSASTSLQQQRGTARALVVQRVVTAVVAVGALAAGADILGLALAVLVGSGTGLAGNLIAVHRLGVRFHRGQVTRGRLADYLRRSWAIGVSAIVLIALFRIDTVILAALKGDAAVGTYAAAYRLLETVLFIVFAVSTAVFPVMSARPDKDRISRGLEKGLTVASTLYLPFGVICLIEADPLLTLLYGTRYAEEGTAVLQWLAFGPLMFSLPFLGGSALMALRLSRGVLLTATTALAVNVASNLVLIPAFSAVGAALSTTTSYLFNGVIVLVVLWRAEVRVRLLRPIAEPLVASALLAVLLWVTPFPLVVSLAAGGVAYALAWFVLVRRFSPEQIAVVLSLLRRGVPR